MTNLEPEHSVNRQFARHGYGLGPPFYGGESVMYHWLRFREIHSRYWALLDSAEKTGILIDLVDGVDPRANFATQLSLEGIALAYAAAHVVRYRDLYAKHTPTYASEIDVDDGPWSVLRTAADVRDRIESFDEYNGGAGLVAEVTEWGTSISIHRNLHDCALRISDLRLPLAACVKAIVEISPKLAQGWSDHQPPRPIDEVPQ
jgi:hypothetical protein